MTDIFADVRDNSDEDIKEFIIANIGDAKFINPKGLTLLHFAAECIGDFFIQIQPIEHQEHIQG